MSNAFVNKLNGYGLLTPQDAALLEAACAIQRTVPARRDLIREGDAPGPVFVMLDGWACRYKILPDGARQIMALMMPGDFCDMHVSILDEMDHSLATVTKVRVATIARTEMELLTEVRPALVQAFWRAQLIDEGILRAWIVSMGRRDSIQRVAHLMCELYIRMRNVGLASSDHCEMPLTQTILADALGLTPVHVNRVLRKLRQDDVMQLRRGALTISNPVQLARIAGFDEGYLHRRVRVAA